MTEQENEDRRNGVRHPLTGRERFAALDGFTHVCVREGRHASAALARRELDLYPELEKAVLVAAAAVLDAGDVIRRSYHDQEVRDLQDKIRRYRSWWASASIELDRYQIRVQSVLSKMGDRELAACLAHELGLLLLPDEATAADAAAK